MVRYESIDWINGSRLIEFSLPVDEWEESVTDKSHFIPMAESVKRLGSVSPLSADVIKRSYDFSDGRDNGMAIPFGRKLGRDIAEISNDVRIKAETINEQLKEGVKQSEIAKSVDAALNRTVSSASVASKPSVS